MYSVGAREFLGLGELIPYLHGQYVSVTGFQNTSPAFMAPAICPSHPPAFPGILQASSAIHVQLESRLALAQHRLYVYLLVT